MKALLVTSRLTFIPLNYRPYLEQVLLHARDHVAGLALVDNLTLHQLSIIPGLAVLGARRMARTLLGNALRSPFRGSERLFESRSLPVMRFPSMNCPRALEFVRQHDFDLIVNSRTNDIYRTPLLQIPRLGCVNVHHGLLPEERGTMCDLFALAENKPAGFSIHIMTPKIDDGPILHRQIVSHPGEKDFMAYVERASKEEGKAVGNLLNEIHRLGRMPLGEANHSPKKVYRKLKATPAEVRLFRKKGVLL